MLDDPILVNDWHVVAYAPDLPQGKPVGARLLGEDLVIWRVGERVHVWRDLCLHRGTRLSLGTVRDETLICPITAGRTMRAGSACASRRIPSRRRRRRRGRRCIRRRYATTGSG